jgi:hypothetical protein
VIRANPLRKLLGGVGGMLDLFTACRNSLELSLLDCRKLYITTIYDCDSCKSVEKIVRGGEGI